MEQHQYSSYQSPEIKKVTLLVFWGNQGIIGLR